MLVCRTHRKKRKELSKRHVVHKLALTRVFLTILNCSSLLIIVFPCFPLEKLRYGYSCISKPQREQRNMAHARAENSTSYIIPA